MRRVCFLLLATAGGLAMAAGPALAATAGSAQVNANASGALADNFNGLPGVTSTQPDTADNLPARDLHAHASVDVSKGGSNRVQTSNDVTATWDNANGGTIHSASSWVIDAHDPIDKVVVGASTADVSRGSVLPAWQYNFDATGSDNLFTMSLDVGVSGDGVGLGKWDMIVIEDHGLAALHTVTTGQVFGGAFTQALAVGHHYSFSFINIDGRDFQTDAHPDAHIVGIEQSDFRWSITGPAGVPEPSSWALAITGFGLAGAALRRAPHRRLA